MPGKKSSRSLILGLSLLAGVLCSGAAFAKMGDKERGTPECRDKYKIAEQVSKDRGEKASLNERAFLADCQADAEAKDALSNVFGSSSMLADGDKQERCEREAGYAKKDEDERRSQEELVSICLAMPANHDSACGFPSMPGEFFVSENGHCVSKAADDSTKPSDLSHGKIAARERPRDVYESGSSGDGESTITGEDDSVKNAR